MSTMIAAPAWLACAVCMGDPDDPNVMAASAAILFMLGVLAAVFGMFILMIRKMVTSARGCTVDGAPWDEMASAAAAPSTPSSPSPRPRHPVPAAAVRPVRESARQLESVR